ncbi:uncharacterized protein TNCV_4808091 [Trichonephila clavipes]|nr:uncharacterized protein TNCV_4808091 [Trichonephila clavipes]
MKLKSPTGRLARWALQLQSFNLNMEYIPGKSNMVADMLSRPVCHEENELCEVCTVAIDVPSRGLKIRQTKGSGNSPGSEPGGWYPFRSDKGFGAL